MDNQGWIKLYRSIENSIVWDDPLRLKAWLWILLHANFEDREWFRNGSVVTVLKGQCVTSNRKLQLAWNCSAKTVKRILDQLTELDMIRVETPSKKYTLLTVVKYSIFQDMGNSKGYTKGYTKGYSEEYTEGNTDYPQVRIEKNANKNDLKEEKKPAQRTGTFGGVLE